MTDDNVSVQAGARGAYTGGLRHIGGTSPGSQVSVVVRGFDPDGTHYLAVRAGDEAGNWSGVSNNIEVTTLPFPQTPWSYHVLGTCPGPESGWGGYYDDVEYDQDGYPAIAFTDDCSSFSNPSKLAEWNELTGSFDVETLPFVFGQVQRPTVHQTGVAHSGS